MNWEEIKKELAKTWILFLFFGLFFLIISAFINAGINNWVNSKSQGPPCRIDIPIEEFSVENNTNFNLEYLFINLRDKNLQIEGISAFCYWRSEEDLNKNIKSVTNPPSIDQISTPQELPQIEASKSQVKVASCKSPEYLGDYKIRIIVQTTDGSCEGNVIMEVKNDS